MIILTLNHALEVTKTLKNFRFIAQQIDPHKLAKIINETHIIGVPANRSRSWPPHITKHKPKRFGGNTA
jgi:hypothetical protein